MRIELSQSRVNALQHVFEHGDKNQLNNQDLYYIGFCYRDGKGVDTDPEKAFQCFEILAHRGDITAQQLVSTCYQEGKGVPQDSQKATYWIEQAALQGERHAQFCTGNYYKEGKGVSKNLKTAVEWFQKVVSSPNQDELTDHTKYSIALCYLNGDQTLPIDSKKGVQWLQNTSPNYGPALYTLGYCYETGMGVPQDRTTAIKLYEQAKQLGVQGAELRIRKEGNSQSHSNASAISSAFTKDPQIQEENMHREGSLPKPALLVLGGMGYLGGGSFLEKIPDATPRRSVNENFMEYSRTGIPGISAYYTTLQEYMRDVEIHGKFPLDPTNYEDIKKAKEQLKEYRGDNTKYQKIRDAMNAPKDKLDHENLLSPQDPSDRIIKNFGALLKGQNENSVLVVPCNSFFAGITLTDIEGKRQEVIADDINNRLGLDEGTIEALKKITIREKVLNMVDVVAQQVLHQAETSEDIYVLCTESTKNSALYDKSLKGRAKYTTNEMLNSEIKDLIDILHSNDNNIKNCKNHLISICRGLKEESSRDKVHILMACTELSAIIDDELTETLGQEGIILHDSSKILAEVAVDKLNTKDVDRKFTELFSCRRRDKESLSGSTSRRDTTCALL